MTRTVKKWVGKTDDTPIPPRVKDRLVTIALGCCAKCGRFIDRGYRFDHIVALINGGQNRESNIQVLCSWCHDEKTKVDVALKKVSYAKRAAHRGLKKRGKTIPGRKFDGTPIPSRWR